MSHATVGMAVKASPWPPGLKKGLKVGFKKLYGTFFAHLHSRCRSWDPCACTLWATCTCGVVAGVQVDPESVAKLPGAPDNGHLEMSMVLATGKRQVRCSDFDPCCHTAVNTCWMPLALCR
jgi:hypothetical protein